MINSRDSFNEYDLEKEKTINIPYPIGTYLITKENNTEHVDRIHEYIINKDGIFVILMLDINKNPRLSNKISIDDLLEKWKKDTDIHFDYKAKIGTKLLLNLKDEEDILDINAESYKKLKLSL